MPTIRAIGDDALREIGVLAEDETMTASQGAIALLRIQHQIDAWAADRLTLAIQTRTSFTLTSGTSTVTLGPAGGTVTMPRPVWIDSAAYVIPSSSPATEVPIAIIRDPATYAAISMKAMTSSLPTSCFYQTSLDTVLGALFFWPQVTQNVTIVIYTPTAIGVPTTLDSILTGPPGYQEAFMYQLALRLVTPFGVNVAEQCPLLPKMATDALATIKRVNVKPGTLGVDPALVPMSGGGYNIYSDNSSGR